MTTKPPSKADALAAFGIGGSSKPTAAPVKPKKKEGLAGKIGRNVFGVIPKPVRKAGLKVAAPIGVAGDYLSRVPKAAALGGADVASHLMGDRAKDAPKGSRAKLKVSPLDALKGGVSASDITEKVLGLKPAGEYKNPWARAGVLALNAGVEVGTDVSTYVTPGVGRVAAAGKTAATAAEDAARLALKTAAKGSARSAAKVALKDAKKITKIASKSETGIGRKAIATKLSETVGEPVANRVLKKGWRAATDEQLATGGYKVGIRVGKGTVIGGKNTAKAVRALNTLSPVRAIDGIREGAKGTAVAEALGRKFEKRPGLYEMGKKSPIKRLKLEQAAELGGRSGEAAKARFTEGVNEALGKKWNKTIRRELDGPEFFEAVEGSAEAAAAIEARHPGLLADWKKNVSDAEYAKLKETNPDLPYTEGHIRRTHTKEFEKHLTDSPDAARRLKGNPLETAAAKISATQRRLKPGDTLDLAGDGKGEVLKTARTSEINEIARRQIGIDVYETDVRRSLKASGNQVAKAAEIARRNKKLLDNGLADVNTVRPIPGAEEAKYKASTEMSATQNWVDEAKQKLAGTQGAVKGTKALEKDVKAEALDAFERAAKSNTAARSVDAVDVESAGQVARQAYDEIGAPAAEQAAKVDAARQAVTDSRTEYNASMRQARVNPDADVNGARRVFNQAQRDLPKIEADQAHIARTEAMKGRALQARIELENARGAAREAVEERAMHWELAAKHAAEADALYAAGDQIGGQVKSLLSQADELRAELKVKQAAAQSAKRAYKDIKMTDLLSEIESGWRKHGFYDGEDLVVKADIKTALVKMESLKTQRPGPLLESFDRIMGVWKSQQLMTPGFHVRNFMGGLFNNWLAGTTHESYALFNKNWRRYKKGGLEAIPNVQIRNAFKNMLEDGSIGSKGQGVKIGEAARGLGQEGSKLNPLSRNFALYRASEIAGDGVENQLRGTLYLDSMLKGMTQEEAFFRTMRFHYNGQFRSQFEDNVLSRLFPFFTYTRNNLPLQWEMLLSQPGKYTAFKHVQDALSANPDPRESPDNLGDFTLRTPFNINGDAAYARPDLQYRDIDQPLREKSYFPKQLTPLVQEGIERVTGTKLSNGRSFDDQPWLNQGQETLKRFIPAAKYLPVGDVNGALKGLGGQGNKRRWEKTSSIVGGVGLMINDEEAATATRKRNAKKGIPPKGASTSTKTPSKADALKAFGI